MHRKAALILLCLITCILAGCGVSWIEAEGPVDKKRYSISIPENWLIINHSSNHLVASRNGPLLESVEVNLHSYDNELANSDRTISADMLPLELVEAIVTDLRANENLFEVELVTSSPIEANGHNGYRFEATYTTKDGLRIGHIEDGYVTEKGLIRAVYTAPMRHYFQAHREEALWMMKTIQIKG